MFNLLRRLRNKLFKRKDFSIKVKVWKNPRMKLEETMYPRFLEVFELDREDYEGAREILDKCIEETYANVYEEDEYEVGFIELAISAAKTVWKILSWVVVTIAAIPIIVIVLIFMVCSPKFRRVLASNDYI